MKLWDKWCKNRFVYKSRKDSENDNDTAVDVVYHSMKLGTECSLNQGGLSTDGSLYVGGHSSGESLVVYSLALQMKQLNAEISILVCDTLTVVRMCIIFNLTSHTSRFHLWIPSPLLCCSPSWNLELSQSRCHGFTLSLWTNSIGHGKVMTLAFLPSVIARCSVGRRNRTGIVEWNDGRESEHLPFLPSTAVCTHNLIQFRPCFLFWEHTKVYNYFSFARHAPICENQCS